MDRPFTTVRRRPFPVRPARLVSQPKAGTPLAAEAEAMATTPAQRRCAELSAQRRRGRSTSGDGGANDGHADDSDDDTVDGDFGDVGVSGDSALVTSDSTPQWTRECVRWSGGDDVCRMRCVAYMSYSCGAMNEAHRRWLGRLF